MQASLLPSVAWHQATRYCNRLRWGWCQNWDRDRRETRNLDDLGTHRPWDTWAALWRWGRRRRDAVAGLNGDHRTGDRLAVGRGSDHLAILRTAVDRAGLLGDLEPGLLQALAGRVYVKTRDARHPRTGAAFDVLRVGRR